MRVSAGKKRIIACIGFASFKELYRHGQLEPEESDILEAPTSVEDLERKVKSIPQVWEKVQDHVMNLPPAQQKEGEMFLNNLAQYFQKLEQAYAQIRQLQEGTSESVPWEDLVVEQWNEKQPSTVPVTPVPQIPKAPKAPEDPAKEPKMMQTKGPWEEKFVEELPKPEEFNVDPSQFDPNLKDLAPKKDTALPKEEKPEFAQSPEEVQKQKGLDSDIATVVEPANKIYRAVSDLINYVQNVPDAYLSKNPEKFKKMLTSGVNDMLVGLDNLKPTIQNLIDQFAFGA